VIALSSWEQAQFACSRDICLSFLERQVGILTAGRQVSIRPRPGTGQHLVTAGR